MDLGDFRTSFRVKLGAGNFGAVFLGENTKDGSLVAFKLATLPQVVPGMDENEKKRAQCIIRGLQTERFILSQFNHPHLLRKFDSVPTVISKNKEIALFVLEYCDNGTLWDYALSGQVPLTESTIKSFISQILSGLKKLHDSGLIHRDLNLRNVLVSGSICKIADFGCSKNLADGDAITAIRTENYAAPEIGSQIYTYKADIYSVGVILEKLLSMVVGQHDSNKLISLSELQKKTGFSRDCFNLLMRMRDRSFASRIDWPEIFTHPWLFDQFVIIDNVLLTINSPSLPPPSISSHSLPSSPGESVAPSDPSSNAPSDADQKIPEPSSSSSSSSSMLSWMWPFSWFSGSSTKVEEELVPKPTSPLPETQEESEPPRTEIGEDKEEKVEEKAEEKATTTTTYQSVEEQTEPSATDVLKLSKMIFGEIKAIHRISRSLRSLRPADSLTLLQFITRELSGSLNQFETWTTDPSIAERFLKLKKVALFETLELSVNCSVDPTRSVSTIVIDHCRSVLDQKGPKEEDVITSTAALIYLTKSDHPDPRLSSSLLMMITLWNDLSNSSSSS